MPPSFFSFSRLLLGLRPHSFLLLLLLLLLLPPAALLGAIQVWDSEERASAARLAARVESELVEVAGLLERREGAVQDPARGSQPDFAPALVRAIVKQRPWRETRGELEGFERFLPQASAGRLSEYEAAQNILDEIRVEAGAVEAVPTDRLLQRARWHSSRALGWEGDRVFGRAGLRHLGALWFAREALRRSSSPRDRIEAAYIVGKALRALWGRTPVLKEIAALESDSIWSTRAHSLQRWSEIE